MCTSDSSDDALNTSYVSNGFFLTLKELVALFFKSIVSQYCQTAQISLNDVQDVFTVRGLAVAKGYQISFHDSEIQPVILITGPITTGFANSCSYCHTFDYIYQ